MAKKTLPMVGEQFAGPFLMKLKKVTLGFSGADVNTGAVQATYPIFNVPANSFVYNVLAFVRTAFTASVTITLGDAASTAGWLSTAKIAPTSLGTNGLHTSTLTVTQDAYAGGKRYDAATDISAVVAGANPAVGLLDVYIVYCENVLALV